MAAPLPRGEARSLNKEMVATINEEVEEIIEQCCNQIHEDLGGLAVEVRTREVPSGKEMPVLMLHHVYLISQLEASTMKETVAAVQDYFGPRGFRIEIEGPRPPLAFARPTL